MKNKTLTTLLIAGFVISSILSIPLVLDPTLTPRFITLSMCVVIACYVLFKNNSVTRVKIDGILAAYLAYTGFCVLSILWTNTRSEAIFESFKQVLGFVVFLLSYYSLRTDKDNFVSALLKVSVVLFVILLLVAVYQASDLQNLSKETLYQVSGLNGHKNLFSSFLFLLLFFLALAAYRLEKPWNTGAIACIVLDLVALFLLKTKAVWVGLFVTALSSGIVYIFFLKAKARVSKTKRIVFLITTILCVNFSFFFWMQPLVQKSIRYSTQISADKDSKLDAMKLEEERLVLWDKTCTLIKKHPILGLGMGNWQIYLPDATLSGLWRGEDLNFTFQRPHNDLLWILSETGFIGFNLFLLFLLSLLFSLLHALRVIPKDKALTWDIILCIAFICGYLGIAFFDFPKERIEHIVWINIIFSFAYYYIRSYSVLKEYRILFFGKRQIVLSGLLLLFVVYTGLLRFKGEFFTRQMYALKNRAANAEVIASAKAALSYAYCIDPTSVPLHWYMGNAHASLGQYAEAQRDFIQAYKYDPYNRNVLNDLASAYVYNNDVIRAKYYYEEAARISPRYDEPKLNLAAMYINAKDCKTADRWLRSIFHDSERRANYQKLVDLCK